MSLCTRGLFRLKTEVLRFPSKTCPSTVRRGTEVRTTRDGSTGTTQCRTKPIPTVAPSMSVVDRSDRIKGSFYSTVSVRTGSFYPCHEYRNSPRSSYTLPPPEVPSPYLYPGLHRPVVGSR